MRCCHGLSPEGRASRMAVCDRPDAAVASTVIPSEAPPRSVAKSVRRGRGPLLSMRRQSRSLRFASAALGSGRDDGKFSGETGRGAGVSTLRIASTSAPQAQERLQRAAIDRQPLLPGKLLIRIGRCDPATFAANDEHVSTCSQDRGELERRKAEQARTISAYSIARPRCHRLFKRWRWSNDCLETVIDGMTWPRA